MSSTATLDEANVLDKAVFFAFDEAREKLAQAGGFEPFTVIVSGEELFVESHTGEDAVECFNSAAVTVKAMAKKTDAYVFCYDGYVSLDSGPRDAIIAERAEPGDEAASAFALLYEVSENGDGSLSFDEDVYGLGEASSLFHADVFRPDQLQDLEEFAAAADDGAGFDAAAATAAAAASAAAADGSAAAAASPLPQQGEQGSAAANAE